MTRLSHVTRSWPALFLLLSCSSPAPNSTEGGCSGNIIGDVCFERSINSVIGQPCGNHVDCKSQAACIQGTCQQECTQDWQCVAPLVCDHWRCLDSSATTDTKSPDPGSPPEDSAGTDTVEDTAPQGDSIVGKECTFHSDCEGVAACLDGKCSVECQSDEDCGEPADWDCIQFQCIGLGPADAGPSDPGKPSDPGTTEPDDTKPSKDLPPKCTEKAAPYGTNCFCKEDCISSMCLGDVEAGKGFCTEECFTSSNCPGTDWCAGLPDGTKVCVKNDAGAPCAQGCLSGTTLVNQQGKCVCTVPCEDASQCPSSMACAQVSGAGKVCVPIGAVCDPNTGSSPCFGVCWPNLSNTWFCTAECASLTDCPAGFTCHTDDLGGGATFSSCL